MPRDAYVDKRPLTPANNPHIEQSSNQLLPLFHDLHRRSHHRLHWHLCYIVSRTYKKTSPVTTPGPHWPRPLFIRSRPDFQITQPLPLQVYITVVATLVFVIPAAIIAACYVIIVRVVWRNHGGGSGGDLATPSRAAVSSSGRS